MTWPIDHLLYGLATELPIGYIVLQICTKPNAQKAVRSIFTRASLYKSLITWIHAACNLGRPQLPYMPYLATKQVTKSLLSVLSTINNQNRN